MRVQQIMQRVLQHPIDRTRDLKRPEPGAVRFGYPELPERRWMVASLPDIKTDSGSVLLPVIIEITTIYLIHSRASLLPADMLDRCPDALLIQQFIDTDIY